MPAYLVVYGTDPTDRLAVYAYADRKAAWEASLPRHGLVPRVPQDGVAGGCAYVIERAEDVPFSGSQLVAVYNGLTGPGVHVNRFENRTVGVQRLLDLLSTKEHNMPDTQEPTTPRTRKRGPISLKDQMIAYNQLAAEARGLGLTVKDHTSTFTSYDQGERRMAVLREKMNTARRQAAE